MLSLSREEPTLWQVVVSSGFLKKSDAEDSRQLHDGQKAAQTRRQGKTGTQRELISTVCVDTAHHILPSMG